MKERIIYADFLKIIACVAVIVIHATATIIYRENIYTNGWMTANFYNSISRWAVPIFIMVSGLFFINFDLKKSLKMSLKTIKILFVWSFIYFVGNATLKNKFYIFDLDFKEIIVFIKNFLKGSISPHLWYLYMLVGLYLSMIFLKKIVENSNKRELQFFIAIGFITYIVIPTITNFQIFSLLRTFTSKLYLNMFGCYFVYLLLGYYINKYNIEKKYRIIFYIAAVFSLFLTYALTRHLSFIDNKINEIFYGNSSINVFFVSVGVFLLFRNINFVTLKDNYKKCIYNIVNKTFGIYLVHQLVINTLNRFNFNLKLFNVALSTPVVVAACFIISYCIIWFIDRNKILKKILL